MSEEKTNNDTAWNSGSATMQLISELRSQAIQSLIRKDADLSYQTIWHLYNQCKPRFSDEEQERFENMLNGVQISQGKIRFKSQLIKNFGAVADLNIAFGYLTKLAWNKKLTMISKNDPGNSMMG